MLNLSEIERSSKALDGAALAAYGRRWLPVLVEELREARDALESMEAERDQWRMDWETSSAELLNSNHSSAG